MSPFPFSLIGRPDGRQHLTIFINGDTVVVDSEHPHFETLRCAVADPEVTADDIQELADLSVAVENRFERLSERITVANGRVYFDGDEIDTAITAHIRRALDAETADWAPLVNFQENIAANPNEHSREQLYDWLRAHQFTITEGGEIVGYKGVTERLADTDADGTTTYSPSYANGYGIVNGERQEPIRQRIGDTVELPRSEVVHDPNATCSFGLHVGTHSYAQRFGSVVLKVAVNPRDVVSVPNHAGGEKVRVCRYRVLDVAGEEPASGPVDEPYVSPGQSPLSVDEEEEYVECDWCFAKATTTDQSGDPACDDHADLK